MAKNVAMNAVTGALVLAVTIWALRARRNPAACPYSQRLFLELPRPLLRRTALRRMLAPRPGERLLEIGPGTGYYTIDVAMDLGPSGRLDILDLQQEMLDTTMHRARRLGLTTIVPAQGNAQLLPYPDATFDAAFMVATLGEVPDNVGVLSELRRVLKPGGRLVVGEGQPDPHMVSLAVLRKRAAEAGFQLEQRMGGRLGYVARFQAA